METTIYIKVDIQLFEVPDGTLVNPDEHLIQLVAGQPFRIYGVTPFLGITIDYDLQPDFFSTEDNPVSVGGYGNAFGSFSIYQRYIAIAYTFDIAEVDGPIISSGINVGLTLEDQPDYVWLGGTFLELFTESGDGVNLTTGSVFQDAVLQKILWQDPDGVYDGRPLLYDAKGGDDLVYLPSPEVAAGIGFDRTIAFQGGSGNDLIFGSSEADKVAGGGDADTLDGGEGADSLSGAAGTDSLFGGLGADTLIGGADDDTYDVDDAGDVVVEINSQGTDRVIAWVDYILPVTVEHLTLIGPGGVWATGLAGTGNGLANLITADWGNDTLNGGNGSDTLSGGNGHDSLNGGAGADSMAGGIGDDSYVVDDAGDLVLESALDGTDLIRSVIGLILPEQVENLALLGATGLTGIGNGLSNRITGGAGNDTLGGAAGADTLDGGSGADSLAGGLDNDTYVVDSALDLLSEAGGGFDLVLASLSWSLGGGLEALTLTGNAASTGTGNGLANVITGNNAANLLLGAGGDDALLGMNGADTLNGGTGGDTMTGGLGSDRYIVDNGFDTVVELPGEGNDSVVASVSVTLGENVEALQLTGTAALFGVGNALANRLAGNEGDNQLDGQAGNDNLIGAGGNDTLNGGPGADVLTGGTGADQFLFGLPSDGPDRITDFTPGEDLLAFVFAGFGLPQGPLAAANFVAHGSNLPTAAFGTAQFIHNTATGVLYFDGDGLGGSGATRIATLTGLPALSEADLLIV